MDGVGASSKTTGIPRHHAWMNVFTALCPLPLIPSSPSFISAESSPGIAVLRDRLYQATRGPAAGGPTNPPPFPFAVETVQVRGAGLFSSLPAS